MKEENPDEVLAPPAAKFPTYPVSWYYFGTRAELHRGPVSRDIFGLRLVAFLGASGLTAEGPSDAGVGPGLIYGAMMRRVAQSVILADHSKFGRPSLSVYGPWTPSVTLVCDAAPAGELAQAISLSGAQVICT